MRLFLAPISVHKCYKLRFSALSTRKLVKNAYNQTMTHHTFLETDGIQPFRPDVKKTVSFHRNKQQATKRTCLKSTFSTYFQYFLCRFVAAHSACSPYCYCSNRDNALSTIAFIVFALSRLFLSRIPCFWKGEGGGRGRL